MKHILFLFMACIALITCSVSVSAVEVTMVKSYFQQETGGGGQIPVVSNNLSEVATFYNDGTVKLRFGTVWKYRGNDAYGNRIYGFVRNEGVSLPDYAYQGLVISSDYSRMQMNYLFGFMGRMDLCTLHTAILVRVQMPLTNGSIIVSRQQPH